ncbi:hypothetical protein P175DRAFT_0482054 [Aspergillus ochraceoroseus IBT 24754]|uniref:3'-5' exonuclease domain-containing protein n=3 Tax=Aspergillus subgen. Nidulantes TaxID=2720870 RepID=A0A0F8TZQ6_9EURO|nr:uncharacterized protein P175DRAFT_0482054 [Aspergillus ochraceoroseus IBT 24754]KKK12793.1 hypothetical protein ARAM_007458 [Aspergillus rambellii]KKK20776.1 hypothetical protein AOCH_003374 [Aspergillus ochraceoroseus]PTU19137.1 hypothetical protein P175DRAFT_0482054 [Aspergillus ochraceoroseus IBT 24754]
MEIGPRQVPWATSRPRILRTVCKGSRRQYSSYPTSQAKAQIASSTGLEKGKLITLSKNLPPTIITGSQETSVEISETPQLAEPPIVRPTSKIPPKKLWSHRLYKTEDGKEIIVHYCKSLKNTENVAKLFLEDKVLGFDMEWKAQATSSDTIQNNVSLIQLANRNRIALFQLSRFKPGKSLKDFISPSLQQILESPDITKVGVSIKADCTRLRKYLGIDTRGTFELSHLHKLVKYSRSNPKLINKKLVRLDEQIEEHFGLPLVKDAEIRCSNWSSPLTYRQVQYAAADAYACYRLFDTLDAKRKALDPVPPLPAHAELNLPIRIIHDPVKVDLAEAEVIEPAPSSKTEQLDGKAPDA